jgi:hypothetical protein
MRSFCNSRAIEENGYGGMASLEDLIPADDPLVPDVIAAFEAAQRAGLPSRDCYLAGVRVWRQGYPDHKPEYASMKAVSVILKAKVRLSVPD